MQREKKIKKIKKGPKHNIKYRLLSDEGSKTVPDVAQPMRKRLSTLLHAQADVTGAPADELFLESFLNGICSCFRRGGLKRGED